MVKAEATVDELVGMIERGELRLLRFGLALAAAISLATPALALDLNSFRAQHGRPALSMSGPLAALAYEQARRNARSDVRFAPLGEIARWAAPISKTANESMIRLD